MKDEKELIKKIRSYFDLNIYETKVWLALLSKGVSSAGEVAEISGVPRSRTYDVLESLEKRGFAIEKLGKPIKYLAVQPKIVIEKLKSNAQKDAEEKISALSNLKEAEEYKELEKLHHSGIEPVKNHDLSTSIKGRGNLYIQMRDTMESAETSVFMATSAFELLKKQKMFTDIFAKLNKRGINTRVIVSESSEDAKKLSKKFRVEIRSKKIKARFVIADRKELIFTVQPNSVADDLDNGIWINSEFFTSSLAYMFDLAWKD